MPVDPISAVVASAKVAYDIAKGISSLHTDVEKNQAISKVLEVLLAVQSDALSMQEKYYLLLREKDDLIKKISEFEKWSEIENQYELKELVTGVLVYAYKQSNKEIQPPHLLCANCFSKKQKGLYIQSEMDFDGTHFKCLNCDKEIVDYSRKRPYPSQNNGPSFML
jgi:hypothetical protein